MSLASFDPESIRACLESGETVTRHPNLVLVGPDGQVQVLGDQAREQLRTRPGRYRLMMGLSGTVVLCQDSAWGHGFAGDRVLLAGEVVYASTLVEVIGMIAAQRWRGELQVFSRDTHRVLLFDQGALKHARSSAPDDRLDQVIVGMGLLSLEEIQSVDVDLDSEQRFGELLVSRGLLPRETVFECLKAQMQQIFFSTITLCEGRYIFSVPDESATPPSVTVHLPVDCMLLEGVERIDEMSLLRERIPHGRVKPVRAQGVEPTFSDPEERSVFEHCDGRRSIEEIAHGLGIDEFECTKAIYQLIVRGHLSLQPEASVDKQVILRLVRSFNGVLELIFSTADRNEGLRQTSETLLAWVQGSGYTAFFGDDVAERGVVDAEKVLLALRTNNMAMPLDSLHQTLHELVAFALFAASSFLPRQEELSLSAEVNRRLGEIRI